METVETSVPAEDRKTMNKDIGFCLMLLLVYQEQILNNMPYAA